MPLNATALFAELFAGNTSVYGIHKPGKPGPEGEKIHGESFTESAPVTEELFLEHCQGKRSLGIVPITEKHEVNFIAMDIDVYPLNPAHYLALSQKFSLPLTFFRSKSGGLHAYIFFREPVLAGKVLEHMQLIRHLFRLPPKTEIFPKQKRLVDDKKGSWINLPYHGGATFPADKQLRYAYSPDGKPLDFETAMNWIYGRRTHLRGLIDCLNNIPFSDGPPCLQAMFINNEVSVRSNNRNIFLFNAAIYLKSRFKSDFPQHLIGINDQLDKPIDINELEGTIIASHSKGNYTYQCEDGNLYGHCDKNMCSGRAYGKGSSTVSDFSFEKLTQVRTNPPYYKWLINGVEMVFYDESELLNQTSFRNYCVRYLRRAPNHLKAATWLEILNQALSDMEIIDVKPGDDFSVQSLFKAYLIEYLTARRLAQRPSQVNMGQVFERKRVYFFKIEDFYAYLKDVKKFNLLTLPALHYNLKKIGFAPSRLYDDISKHIMRVWSGELPADLTVDESAIEDITIEEFQAGSRLPKKIDKAELLEGPHKTEPGLGRPPKSKRDDLMSAANSTKPKTTKAAKKAADKREYLKELAETIKGPLEDEEPLDFSHLKDDGKF
jgi:hypothetical protein